MPDPQPPTPPAAEEIADLKASLRAALVRWLQEHPNRPAHDEALLRFRALAHRLHPQDPASAIFRLGWPDFSTASGRRQLHMAPRRRENGSLTLALRLADLDLADSRADPSRAEEPEPSPS